jgi:AcrR family transcriptional regulator
MARWEPNAGDRLTMAAMELFEERGYGNTTAKEIAERAGLTERSFFRHFTDKREVLFAGSADFEKAVVDAVRAAPKQAAPLDVVLAGYESMDAFFEQRRPFSRRRGAIIAAHSELQERELSKLRTVTASIAEVLKQRGTSPTAASLAAEAGLSIMKVGFEQWLADPKDRSFVFHIRAARRQLVAVVEGSAKR